MTRSSRLLLTLLIAVPAAAACGKSGSPTAPQTPAVVHANIAGTWNGRAHPVDAFEGFQGFPISITIAQTGTAITGNFTCQGFFCIAPAGTVTATVNVTTFTAQITFPNGGICGTFKGAVSADGQKMNGTYVCTLDGGSDEGTWEMTRAAQ